MYKSKEDFAKELAVRFPSNNIEILEYIKASGPITYQCLDCGKIYKKTRANHLYENITLCSKCYSGRTSQLRDAFIKRNGVDYEILDNVNKSIDSKFHIRCLKCGMEFDYKIQLSILNEFSCRYCGKNGYPTSLEEFEKRMKSVTDEFKVIKYKKFTSSALFQHNCGYVFSKLPHNHLNSLTCPKCKPRRSKGEQIIYQWLNNNKIKFEEQKKFKELGRLSFDFYLFDYNLLIEYQGEQHTKPIDYFGGEEKFKLQVENDKKKLDFARRNGYTLLPIFYYEIDKIEEILKGSTTKVE